MERRLPALLFLLALALRLAYLYEQRHSPYFSTLVLDAEEYAFLGAAFAKGEWAAGAQNTYVHGPLYPLVLAVFSLLGAGLTALRVFQALLGAASCVLVYWIARPLFQRPTPALAGFFSAGYWLLVFYTGEVQAPTLVVFLELLLVALLLRHARRPSLGQALGAGLLLGLLFVAHHTAVLLLPAAGWSLWRGSAPQPRRMLLAGALGLLAVLGLSSLRTLFVQGTPLPFQGAWSLYLGTNPQADGTPFARQGLDWQRLESLPHEAGMGGTPGEKARYYLGAAADFVVSHPADYLELLYRKFRLFWHHFEVPVSEDLAYYQVHSRVLQLLPLGFGALAPLALVGLAWGWVRRWEHTFLAGLILSHLGAGLLFTVCARYRLPALPLLLIFAAEGARQGAAALRQREMRRAGWWALSLGAACALVFTGVNPREADPVRSAWLQGHVFMRRGEHALAESAFLRGLEERGPDADVYNSLGAAREWLGREAEAEAAYRQALALAPDHARPRLNLGKLYLKQGRLPEAAAEMKTALDCDPPPPAQYEGHLLLAQVYQRAGREAEARAALARARSLAPR